MYFIAMPLGYWMAFTLEWGFEGAYTGMVIGIILVMIYYTSLITCGINWLKVTSNFAKKNKTYENDLSSVMI